MIDGSYNKIVNIPTQIGNLSKLEKLFLSNNQITELPKSICELKNLKNISLINNNIEIGIEEFCSKK